MNRKAFAVRPFSGGKAAWVSVHRNSQDWKETVSAANGRLIQRLISLQYAVFDNGVVSCAIAVWLKLANSGRGLRL